MEIDETMSQDTAFTSENNQGIDTFKFDDVKETSPESLPKEETVEDTSDEESSTEEDGQKVPYSRFKKKVDELNEVSSKISFLEEQLEEIRNSRTESKTLEITPDEAWTKLYGDNEDSKNAWKIQQDLLIKMQEDVLEKTIDRLGQREQEEIKALSQNEEIIDSNLDNLQDTIGRKLTPKQEEEILSIVDEFSPTGNDGKYITLFPFDKAYEIYSLRNNSKQRPVTKAREDIANLTGNNSDGEIESTSGSNRRGWDSWREAI